MGQQILEVMNSFNEYLEKLKSGCNEIASKLRQEDSIASLNLIGQFSEGLGWIVSVNEKLNNLNYTNELSVQSIHAFLNEINGGLEQQDFYLVADLFEYEIKPFIESINKYNVN